MGIAGINIDVGSVLNGIGSLAKDIRSAITGEISPEQKAAIQQKLLEIENQGLQAQVEVNKIEAQHASVFVSGWRPAVGWCCVLGLAYSFLIQPLCTWGATIFHYPAPPILDTGVLFQLLVGMLGLAGFRSWEKKEGVAKT
jgi:hypothetical protein